MSSITEKKAIQSPCAGRLLKWHRHCDDTRRKFVKKGDKILSVERFVLDSEENVKDTVVDVLSPCSGNLVECFVDIMSEVAIDTLLAYLLPCNHPALFNSMCVSCGDIVPPSASLHSSSTSESTDGDDRVTLLSSGRQLQLRKSEAEFIQEAKQSGLRSSQKLALVLDLDHTLIHACERRAPPVSLDEEASQGIHSISLEEMSGYGYRHYMIKFRPYLHHFLNECSKLCQLSIYTAGSSLHYSKIIIDNQTIGTRKYAEGVAKLMDPEGKLFLGRIVSRSDTASGGSSDMAVLNVEKSLSKVFLGDTSLAVILDDREDVWKGSQSEQLLLVRPFKYFSNIQEVNNPSGLLHVDGNSSSSTAQQPAILLSSNPPGIAASNQSFADSDDQLLRSLEVVKMIHHEIFQRNKATVAKTLNDMKSLILQGCRLVLAGLISADNPRPQSHLLWTMSTSLGAEVTREFDSRTTHVIATSTSMSAVIAAKERGNVWILHPDWLLYCRWSLARAKETTFSIIPLDPEKLPDQSSDTDQPSKKRFKIDNSSESSSSVNQEEEDPDEDDDWDLDLAINTKINENS